MFIFLVFIKQVRSFSIVPSVVRRLVVYEKSKIFDIGKINSKIG